MKRKLRDRVLSLFLSALMVFSCMPTSVFATNEEIDKHEHSDYNLFIDQKTEYGTIIDTDKEKEYVDIYTEKASMDGSKLPEIQEGETQIEPPEVFHKAAEYLCHDKIKLKLEAEEGYELDKLIVKKLAGEKAGEERDEVIEIEYEIDEDNIVMFEMPEFDISMSATFKKISRFVFVDQQLEHGSISNTNIEKAFVELFEEIEGKEEPILLYKSFEYEAGSEVMFQLGIEEGYEIDKIIVEKSIIEGEKPFDVEFKYDAETNIISFTMPSFNVKVSTDFKEKSVEGQPDEKTDVKPSNDCENNGHSYEDSVTAPTCTEKGYTTHTCSKCGDSYSDSEVESLGHSYTEEITKEATETEEGLKTFTCGCGDSYTETIQIKAEKKTEETKGGLLTNPAPSKNASAANDGDATVPNIYIRDISTQLFYGAEETSDGYVWTAVDYNKDHRFSFRINYAISGEDVAPADSVRLVIPKSILTNRNGERADYYEMSVPSKAEVDAYLSGTGEEIKNDVNWAFTEIGENIVIYNFREVPAGDNGYIELSYITSQTTFNYVDMAEQKPFTCVMTVPAETKEAAPITVKINTNAVLSYVDKRYPTKYETWVDTWGDEVRPQDDTKYKYLVWTIDSYINATQPYNLTLEDSITGNFEGMEVLGYKFSGQSEFSSSNKVENQTQLKNRYDYVLTSIPLDVYGDETYWEAVNTITATVDPIDQLDEDTQDSDSQKWTWTKPLFIEPEGHVNVFKRADGAYRQGNIWKSSVHKAPSLGFNPSEYTRYDLESFNGYNGAEIENTTLDGFEYASWLVAYPYPWTYDNSYENTKSPDAYGRIPVKFELIDEGVRLTDDTENAENYSEFLTSEDFRFDSLGYSWFMTDAVFNAAEQKFEETEVIYTESDILTFYGKFGDSDEWVEFASYNLYTQDMNYNEDYVEKMTGINIVFNDDVDMVAYKVVTTNTHYYTELFTLPRLTLKNSEKVMDYVKDKPAIGIFNNNKGIFYGKADINSQSFVDFATIEKQDTEYARISERYSSLIKDVIAVSNNARKRTYTISWRVEQKESVEWGFGGDAEYVPQNGGTFYDLLPAGSVLNKDSIDVEVPWRKFLPTSAYTVETIENYKNTGRTMLIINIHRTADYFTVYYDTIHSWDSLEDYGKSTYNPVAYETGNDVIAKGSPDNGGKLREAKLMSSLNSNPDDDVSGAKFIYAEKTWDVSALTAASAGLMKKVKAENDKSYSYETTTSINKTYFYQLRYMNSQTSASMNMIFFDSLENYDYDTMRNYGTLSDWRGTLQSIDVNQLKDKGIAPVIYYSTIPKLDLEENCDIEDSSVWQVLTDSVDLTTVKAIAIDMRTAADGGDFVLQAGESVTATIYMKAPSECPEVENGYAYTYNNIYMNNTVFNPEIPNSAQNFLIHQDYTTVKLLVTGDFGINKVSVESNEIKVEGIEFRLFGTSDYGTAVDEILTTDSNGQIYFENIEMGSYILQEYKANDDWLLDTTEHRVKVDSKGKVWIDGIDYTDNYITIRNEPRIHADFEFFKKELDNDDVGIQGAKFRLYGISDYGTETLMYETSAGSGKVSFKNIEMGTYKLEEVAANPNYILNDIVYTVKVDEKGSVVIVSSNETDDSGATVPIKDSIWCGKDTDGNIVIYNEYKFEEIFLRKVDAENKTVFLEGAIFSLIGTSDSGNKVAMTASSDENGLIEFHDIEQGTYILKEIQAPSNLDELGNIGGELNYMLDETEYIVRVEAKGVITIEGLETEANTGYFIFENARAYDKEIVITKVWEDDLTSEERIEQGLIPKLHLTNRDLSKDPNFHTHTYDEGIVLSDSTCSMQGEMLYTCTECKATHVQKLPLKEHAWDNGVKAEPYIPEDEGIIYTCTTCKSKKRM